MTPGSQRDDESAVVLIGGELRAWSDRTTRVATAGALTDLLLRAVERYEVPRVLLIGPTASTSTADLLASSDAEVHVVLRALDDARHGALESPAATWYAGSFPGFPASTPFDVIVLADDLADVVGSDLPEDVTSFESAVLTLSRSLTPRGVLLIARARWNSLEAVLGPPATAPALARSPLQRGLHRSPDDVAARAGLAVAQGFDLWPTVRWPSLLTPVDLPVDAPLTRAVLRGWYEVDPREWHRDPLRFLLSQGGVVDPSISAGTLFALVRADDEDGTRRWIGERRAYSSPWGPAATEGEIVGAALHRAILVDGLPAARDLLGRYLHWVASGTAETAASRAIPWRVVVDSGGSFTCDLTDGAFPVVPPGTAVGLALLHLATTHVSRRWPGPWASDCSVPEVVRALGALAGRDVTPDEIATARALAATLEESEDVGWGVRLVDGGPARDEERDHWADLRDLAAERAEQIRWLEGTIRAREREVRSLRGALSIEGSAAYRFVDTIVRAGPALRRRSSVVRDRLSPKRSRGS